MLLDKTERIYESKKDSYLARRTKKGNKEHIQYIYSFYQNEIIKHIYSSRSQNVSQQNLPKNAFLQTRNYYQLFL